MTDSKQHILIIGAGLGGLCLAQGLKRAGVSFSIFERDPSPDFRPQGYRIRINHDGATALSKCLPKEKWELFEQTCADIHLGSTSINAVDAKVTRSSPLGPAGRDPALQNPGEPVLGPYSVDRTTFRWLLMLDLEEHIQFGKVFAHFKILGENQVTADFADGTSATGTFLVAADGARSLLRRQHLPQILPVDTTGRAIYGKTPITPELLQSFPPVAMRGITLISDSRPITLFLEAIRFSRSISAVSSGRLRDVQDYVYWVLISRKENFNISDDKLLHLSGEEAAKLSLELTKGWDTGICSLLHSQATHHTSAIRISSCLPAIPEWEPSPVLTFLGDAIHVMSPSGGVGANTALRDAANLFQVIQGGVTKARVGEYEAKMRVYAGDAIQGSHNGGKFIYNQPPFEECQPVDY